MECVYPEIRNCQPDQICPDGYECCSENVPKGGQPKLGICVRANQCDKTRGLPKQSCRDDKYREMFQDRLERIDVHSQENYGKEDRRRTFWLGLLLLVLVIALISYRKRIVRYLKN